MILMVRLLNIVIVYWRIRDHILDRGLINVILVVRLLHRLMIYWRIRNYILERSKKGCKDQESIQSSTTPDPGYQWESDKLIVRHHK